MNFAKGLNEGLNLEPAAAAINSNMAYKRAQLQKDIDEQRQIDRYSKEQDIREQNANQKALAKTQEQFKAAQQLLKGGTTVPALLSPQNQNQPQKTNGVLDYLTPKATPNQPQDKFTPYDDATKMNFMQQMGLTPNEAMERIEPKKEYDFVHKPHMTIAVNRKTGQIDPSASKDYGSEINPLYKPKYQKQEIEGYKNDIPGKVGIRYGNYDPEMGEYEKDSKGNPKEASVSYIDIKARGKDQHSKEYEKATDKKWATLRDLKAQADFASKNGYALDADAKKVMVKEKQHIHGKDVEVERVATPKEIQSRADAYAEQYATFVKDSATPQFKNVYKTLWNGERKDKSGKVIKGANPGPDAYWVGIHQAYKKHALSDQDLHSARLLFEATYGKDPMREYNDRDPYAEQMSNSDNSSNDNEETSE